MQILDFSQAADGFARMVPVGVAQPASADLVD
jgi:hypothetical protein